MCWGGGAVWDREPGAPSPSPSQSTVTLPARLHGAGERVLAGGDRQSSCFLKISNPFSPISLTCCPVDTTIELVFFQESFPSEKMSGEFLHDLNGEEFFHVDWDKRQNVWRLPNIRNYFGFDAQGAVGNMDIMKNNMEVLIKRSNRTRAQNVPPSASVYLKNPMGLGDPNLLICFVDQFFPPVLNITWLKNGEEVSEGVMETDFYPSTEATFRKFSYLTFIPEHGDFYVCKVDHWGLTQSLTKLWHAKEPAFISETKENVVCGLGLTIGILGIIIGTILFFKARRIDCGNQHRGPL